MTREENITYTLWNESIIQTRIKTECGYLSVLAVYAPEESDEEGNKLVYSRLQEITNKVQIPDYLVIMGELNARVGIKKIQSALGTHDEGKVNRKSKRLIDYAL
jgi:hypothetical protein